jgi:hypothetical protein
MSMDRRPHVAATILTILSVAAMMCGDDGRVRGWSKYEEMGPLAVTSFQTQHPELVYVVQCNPWTVAIAPSPPDDTGYQKPPTRLFVASPTVAGRYPVLLFKHGFLLANCAYSSILRHVASYGYIAVAPQVKIHRHRRFSTTPPNRDRNSSAIYTVTRSTRFYDSGRVRRETDRQTDRQTETEGVLFGDLIFVGTRKF